MEATAATELTTTNYQRSVSTTRIRKEQDVFFLDLPSLNWHAFDSKIDTLNGLRTLVIPAHGIFGTRNRAQIFDGELDDAFVALGRLLKIVSLRDLIFTMDGYTFDIRTKSQERALAESGIYATMRVYIRIHPEVRMPRWRLLDSREDVLLELDLEGPEKAEVWTRNELS